MADVVKKLTGGVLTSTVTTLYTSPSTKKVIVTELLFGNKSATGDTLVIRYSGSNGSTPILYGEPINANNALIVKLNSVLEPNTQILGAAAFGNEVHYWFSGVEVG